MTSTRKYFTQILLLIVCTNLAGSGSLVFGQRKASATAANKGTSAPKCSGAWTGTVTYKRTQARSNQKRVERVSGRGHDSTNWEMKYEYNARVAVTDVPGKSPLATINQNMTSTETVDAVESNSCDRGKTWKEMRGTSKSQTKTTGSEKADANVNVGVNSDGTYTVSVALPQIKGETSGSQTSEYSGQCTRKEGKSLTMPPTPTTIDGNSLTSSGSHRIDPADPNHIAGSFENTWQDVTETIEWNLKKCGAPLRLTDLKFEDMKWPDWNAWKSITEQTGTIDGNLVKIKATVLNLSGETKYADVKFKETYKGDKWDGARPDAALDDTVISVRVEPGEEKEVEMVWDSSGYAWFDDGRPQIAHLVMLGTPNMGSPCADVMNTAFEALGKNVEAVRQLRQDVAEEFNRVNVNRKGVKFSVLAGDPLPTMCKSVVWNDGVVPVQSAIWKIKDNAKSKSLHTDLTGTSDFSSFVKLRLAIGPKGNHMPEAPDASQLTGSVHDVGDNRFIPRFYGAMNVNFDESIDRPASIQPFAKEVRLGAKQTIEIDIPVETANNFGVTFMAVNTVSATLLDHAGATVGKNLSSSPESGQWFRSIFIDKPVTASIWKLRLENTSDREVDVTLTAWASLAR